MSSRSFPQRRTPAVPPLEQTEISYFDCSDLQLLLFAIFIFGVAILETYLMTSVDDSVSEPPNLEIFSGRIPPHPGGGTP